MSPREYPASIDYGFAAVSAAEADHNLYMVKELVRRARDGRPFSEQELRDYAGRLKNRVDALMHALELADEK